MPHLESVTEIDDVRSHWVARGPLGVKVEWDADIVNDIPNRLIAWRSRDGADLVSAGSVHFRRTLDGTDVHVRLQYAVPAGRTGATVAWLFGEAPGQEVREGLDRLRNELERAAGLVEADWIVQGWRARRRRGFPSTLVLLLLARGARARRRTGTGRTMAAPSNWAVVLAGGDGTRLQTLTRLINGDERPKQFAPLLGGRSLVAETRARLCLNVEPEHTVCVVTRHHEPYYRRELADLPRTHLLEQPLNRGTTSAIAAALVRIRRLAGDAVVGFFPADHYYRDACLFRRTVAAMFTAAHADPERIFLLGAEATRPETDYGWIQPGDPLKVPQLDAARRTRAYAVRRFHEKPTEPEAIDLFARRCLWNTFVFAGRARAFEAAIALAQPHLWRRSTRSPRCRASTMSSPRAGACTARFQCRISRATSCRRHPGDWA